MKHIKPVLIGLITLLIVHGAEAQHKYDSWEQNYNVQALLGAVSFEHLKFDVADSATPKEVDHSLLPQLGGAWFTLPRGDRFQYGLETSFLLGFRVDDIQYISVNDGTLRVKLSSTLWMFDLAGGVYANLYLDPGRNVRIYVGGGPLMMYVDYQADREFSDDSPDEEDGESAFGIGVYARSGFEFRVHEKGMLGLGVRGSWSNVDFTDIGGRSDVVGLAGFVTYTAGF